MSRTKWTPERYGAAAAERDAFEWLRRVAIGGTGYRPSEIAHARVALRAWQRAHQRRAELEATREVVDLAARLRDVHSK